MAGQQRLVRPPIAAPRGQRDVHAGTGTSADAEVTADRGRPDGRSAETAPPLLGRVAAGSNARMQRGPAPAAPATQVQRDGTGTAKAAPAENPQAWETIVAADPQAVAAVAKAMAQLELVRDDGGLESTAKAAVEAKAGAVISANQSLATALQLAAGAKVSAEISAGIGAKAQAAYGGLTAEVESRVSAFVKAQAAAQGAVKVSPAGVEIGGELVAELKAGVDGGATAKMAFNNAEVEAMIKGELLAKASAKAKGELKVTLSSVVAEAKLEAMAGVSAAAKAGGSIKLGGATFVKVDGEIKIMAGVGVEFGGKFAFDNGKLTISVQAGAALGVGASVSTSALIDFKTLADNIVGLLDGEFAAIDPELLKPLLSDTDDGAGASGDSADWDPAKIVDHYRTAFQKYTDKKADTGEHFVKQERVQEHIDAAYAKFAATYGDAEVDAAIFQAAKETFMAAGQVTAFGVKDGQIKLFNVNDKPKK